MIDDNIVKIKKINNHLEAKFGYIDGPDHPRKFSDPLDTIVVWHPKYQYILSDTYNFETHSDFLESCKDHINNMAIMQNLYIHEHSNISLSLHPFSDCWDSGQIGYIYITKENYNEYFNKELDPYTYIINSIKEMEQYINNNVYCIDIYKNNNVIITSSELYIEDENDTLLNQILIDLCDFNKYETKQIHNTKWEYVHN